MTHVLVVGGGREPSTNDNAVPYLTLDVIQTSGEECRNHGVPDFPTSLYDGAMVRVADSSIFWVGGRVRADLDQRSGKA